ncbi:MAG: hypothetical protein KBG40_08425 [Bacteroidales bacterium]|nr:hypothetical protein [Bacteroidales bacterium]
MKHILKIMIAGIVLTAGFSTLHGQRGIGRMNDSIRMKRSDMNMQMRRAPETMQNDTARFRNRGYRGGEWGYFPGYKGFWHFYGYGAGRGFAPSPFYGPEFFGFRGHGFIIPPPTRRPGWNERPAIERIPDLTEKQKQEIDKLKQNFQKEMKVFREENQKKAENMRNTYKENVLKVLTPEQKKWLEERDAIPPVKQK